MGDRIEESGRMTSKKRGKNISAEALKLRLAGLCARSEQCEYDLRQKCRKAGLSGSETDNIITFLIDNRYLDASRFARAYCNDKVKFSGWGTRKIRQGLIAKRIPSTAISQAIREIDRKEYVEALKRVGIGKARTLNLQQEEDRAKFYRFMASRGFESELITRLMDTLRRRTQEADGD